MRYVVIEFFGMPELLKDSAGDTEIYDDLTEAQEAARNFCKNGLVVPLSRYLVVKEND